MHIYRLGKNALISNSLSSSFEQCPKPASVWVNSGKSLSMSPVHARITLWTTYSSTCLGVWGRLMSCQLLWAKSMPYMGYVHGGMPHASREFLPAAKVRAMKVAHRKQDYSLTQAKLPEKSLHINSFQKCGFVVMTPSIHLLSLYIALTRRWHYFMPHLPYFASISFFYLFFLASSSYSWLQHLP